MGDVLNKILMESIEKAREHTVDFITFEKTIGDQHPLGYQEYFKQLIFKLKQEASQGYLGGMWANDGFPEVKQGEVKGALIELGKRHREIFTKYGHEFDTTHFQEMAYDFWFAYLKIKGLEEYLKVKSKAPKRNVSKNITLESLFVTKHGNNEGYQRIMNELVANGYCYEDTHYWKTPESYKRILASLIKYMGVRYLDNIPNNDVVLIAKNTFNMDIGIDTVKRSSSEKPFLTGDF